MEYPYALFLLLHSHERKMLFLCQPDLLSSEHLVAIKSLITMTNACLKMCTELRVVSVLLN